MVRRREGAFRPLLGCRLVNEPLGIDGEVALILDTGAPGNTLALVDAAALRVTPPRLPRGSGIQGFGPLIPSHELHAQMVFESAPEAQATERRYAAVLQVPDPETPEQSSAANRIPSSLGTDWLRQHRLAFFFDPGTSRVLLLEPDEAEALYTISRVMA